MRVLLDSVGDAFHRNWATFSRARAVGGLLESSNHWVWYVTLLFSILSPANLNSHRHQYCASYKDDQRWEAGESYKCNGVHAASTVRRGKPIGVKVVEKCNCPE